MFKHASCLYCGTTRQVFVKKGKVGCSHCYTNLLTPSEIYRYSNLSKFAFYKIAQVSTFQFDLKSILDSLLFQGISIRFRFARNLKNFPFQISESFMDSFFEKSQKVFKNYFNLSSYHWKYSNDWLYLDLFDEDHFRIYCYPKSKKEIIEFFNVMRQLDKLDEFAFHKQYKFLTACPTNSYLANKVSILIELNNVIDKKIVNPNWIHLNKRAIDLPQQKIIFFIKNFTFLDLKKFFEFWQNFTKSKTSSNK